MCASVFVKKFLSGPHPVELTETASSAIISWGLPPIVRAMPCRVCPMEARLLRRRVLYRRRQLGPGAPCNDLVLAGGTDGGGPVVCAICPRSPLFGLRDHALRRGDHRHRHQSPHPPRAPPGAAAHTRPGMSSSTRVAKPADVMYACMGPIRRPRVHLVRSVHLRQVVQVPRHASTRDPVPWRPSTVPYAGRG
jgi:hypothetical protein